MLHYQEAWIYYHANQWDKAIPLFEQVIKRFPTETSIVRRCQFSLSNIYVEQGDLRKGEAVLEKVFAEDPENPSVNNDLGYLYADQGKKLKQAEQMIRKALKAEPKNSAYQDSMGWVLFKIGKLDEALEQLEQLSPRQAQIVVCRFFGGLTLPEIASAIEVSLTTVEKEWRRARAWLATELS